MIFFHIKQCLLDCNKIKCLKISPPQQTEYCGIAYDTLFGNLAHYLGVAQIE